MHISITGDLGSGKTSVAKEICSHLNYKFISTGLIQRELGLKKGMNTLEFNKYTDNNKEVDQYIDQHLIDISNGTQPFVLDSRLAWFFVKNSFKVYLMAFEQIAAQRILNDSNRIGEPSAEDIIKKISDTNERRKIENNRFQKTYGIQLDIYENFDLVIDASFASVAQIRDLILSSYKKWQDNIFFNRIWLSAPRFFPTESVRNLTSPEAKEIRSEMEKTGYDENHPILSLRNKDFFFIYDGHKRFSASLFNKIGLIPTLILAKDPDEISPSFPVSTYVKDSFNLSWIYDWEDIHSFKYFAYPAL